MAVESTGKIKNQYKLHNFLSVTPEESTDYDHFRVSSNRLQPHPISRHYTVTDRGPQPVCPEALSRKMLIYN